MCTKVHLALYHTQNHSWIIFMIHAVTEAYVGKFYVDLLEKASKANRYCVDFVTFVAAEIDSFWTWCEQSSQWKYRNWTREQAAKFGPEPVSFPTVNAHAQVTPFWSYVFRPRSCCSVGWALGCFAGCREFDFGRTNTRGLKITE